MEKFIGQEYTDPQEREQFLRDNADAIEKMGYSKPIPSDQVEKLKETLADASIKKLELEEQKKAQTQMLNEEIKGYKNTIKRGGRQAQEQERVRERELLQDGGRADTPCRVLQQRRTAGL